MKTALKRFSKHLKETIDIIPLAYFPDLNGDKLAQKTHITTRQFIKNIFAKRKGEEILESKLIIQIGKGIGNIKLKMPRIGGCINYTHLILSIFNAIPIRKRKKLGIKDTKFIRSEYHSDPHMKINGNWHRINLTQDTLELIVKKVSTTDLLNLKFNFDNGKMAAGKNAKEIGLNFKNFKYKHKNIMPIEKKKRIVQESEKFLLELKKDLNYKGKIFFH